ncbi:MAG: tetratricopeptide repeat protein [Deltaproteobacteria bacterium]|nr:tetratricopeptide repeat protein [Deltaproteobacteria bacterium]
MGTWRDAARALPDHFKDRGAATLRVLDLGPTWEVALGALPEALYTDAPPSLSDEEWYLSRIRDYLTAHGEHRRAAAVAEATHTLSVAAHGPQAPPTLLAEATLGMLLDRSGETELALPRLRAAWDGLRFQLDAADLRVGRVCAWYGAALVRGGDLEGAERALAQAHTIHQRSAPDKTEVIAAQLGEVRVRLGQLKEAVPVLREAWRAATERHGATSPQAIRRARPLGLVLHSLGWNAAAIPILREVYQVSSTSGAPRDWSAAAQILGAAVFEEGSNPEEALRLAETAVRLSRQHQQEQELPARLTLLARILLSRGHVTDAEGLQQEALELERRLYGDASLQVALRFGNLGHHYAGTGDLEQAMGWMEASASLLNSATVADPRMQQEATSLLIDLLLKVAGKSAAKGDRKQAITLLKRGMDMARPALGPGHPLVQQLLDARDALGSRRV